MRVKEGIGSAVVREVEQQKSRRSSRKPEQQMPLAPLSSANVEAKTFDAAQSPVTLNAGKLTTRAPKAVRIAVDAALTGAVTGEEVAARLGQLGFLYTPDQPREGTRFALGKLKLEVKPRAVADLKAFEVELGKTSPLVFVEGVPIDHRQFTRMRERLERTVESFDRALERRGGAGLPTTLDHLKKFLAAGEKKKVQREERAQDVELRAKMKEVVDTLKKLRAEGRAPKGIIVYVDGPDGAGKSSTGGIILEALEKAGFLTRSDSFKAPTAEERKQHWLKRFERGVPAEGEAVYWDRGPAGDAAYGKPDAKKLARMAKDVEKFDRDLAGRGILQFKIELFADPEKQAETMGKRLGRRVIAERIEKALAARGDLSPEAAKSLANIRGKIDPDDLSALANYDEIQARFLDFAKRTGGANAWNIVDATRRHHARMDILDRFLKTLQNY